MRFTVQHPIASPTCAPEFLEPRNVVRIAQAAEAAGIAAFAFTEHPVPSEKWRASGGHESFDPLTALTFCAAVTETIALLPYLLILPYRNPFLAAKQIATLDTLSGGRVILGVGVGYLRSEFAALGVDFAEREELLDEAVEVLQGIWTTDGFAFTGKHFFAKGQTSLPRPSRVPPIWVGGNSIRARDRVVRYGQGWAPLLIDADKAATIGTAAIATIPALAEAIADLRRRAEVVGRNPAEIEVQIEGPAIRDMDGDTEQMLDLVGQLADAGVGWMIIDPPSDSIERSLDVMAAFGENVAAKVA